MDIFRHMGKDKMINVRLSVQAHHDFRVACELRGLSMSSMLHQFIVRTIREEREREPAAFVSGEIRAGREISHYKPPRDLDKVG